MAAKGIYRSAGLIISRMFAIPKTSITEWIARHIGFHPTFTMAPVVSTHPLAATSHPLGFDGFLYAVPKKRRTVEKRRGRKFGWAGRMENFQPKTDIVECATCGHWHESATICGFCYDVVQRKTNQMKRSIDRLGFYNDNPVSAEDIHEELTNDKLETKVLKHLNDKKALRLQSERERYERELTWWNENLKSKST